MPLICKTSSICAGALAALFCSAAQASFTTVNPPPFGEDRQDEILTQAYGGTFKLVAGTHDYSNGTITAARVEDIYTPSITGPTAPLSKTENDGNDDQVWTANYKLASAEAIFSVYSQQFGYLDGASGSTTFHQVYSLTGYGYGIQQNGSGDLSGISGKTVRFAINGDNGLKSSLNSDNPDHVDHLTTYRIDGLKDGMITWILMWEDKIVGQQRADFDYDDQAVQIKAIPISSPVPEPTSAAILISAGLIGLAKRRRA